MPVGAEFFTDTGVVQIDDTAAVLCLRYTGSATVVNRHPASLNTSAYIAKTVDITVTAEAPIIAIAGPGAYGVIAAIQNGSTWTFRVIGFEHNPTFQYFIFDKPIAAASGAGFEVYDANGNIMFSSLYRPFIPVAFAPEPNGTGHIALPTGRSYASICNARITLTESSEHYTDDSIWTFWTYDLTTGYAGPSTIGGSDNGVGFVTNAIAGGVNQGPTSPVYPTGDLGGWGAGTSLLAVDVTDLIGTPGGSVAPIASLSTTFRKVLGAAGTTITDAVTCSASGGAGGPYSFQWDKVGGDSAIVFYGVTNQASMRTQWVNQPAGTKSTAQFRCRVTDGGGNVTFTQPVTFEHEATAASDPNLDPLNWADCNFTTTANTGAGSNAALTITGISQQVNLRFTLSNLTTDFSGGDFYIYKNGVRSRGATGFGNGFWTDVDVVNGDQVYFYYDAYTVSGRRTLTGTITVTNTTTGATVDTFTIGGTLDSDGNWNIAADHTPNPISVPALTLNTNEPSGYTQDGQFQITGINQPIVLRFTRGNQVDSGGVFTRRLFIYHSTNGGGSYTEYFIGAGPQGIADITVNNGDYILLRGYFDTSGGRGFSSYTGYVTNQTTGVQLASFSVSGTVDANDDYDRVRITFDDCVLDIPEPAGNTSYSQRTISGLLRPHVLRFTRDDVNTMFMQGNVMFGRQIIGHNVGGNSAWTWHTLGAGVGAAVEFTVNNGDLIYVHGYVETSAGAARAAWSTYMSDLTTGEYISSWYTNGLVDNDNNFNVVGPPVVSVSPAYFDQWEYTDQGQTHTVYVGRTNITISGGQAPFQYTWERMGGLSGWSVGSYTTYADFYYTGRTNFSNSADYRLKITDALGRVGYSEWVSVTAAAGNIQN